MTPTLSPQGDSLSALRAGDERALERVFRDHYASLTSEAAAEIQGAATAAVVVERAFLSAWNARERFDTPEALDAFLHGAVHDAAVREKYRRAVVHHMNEHGPTPAPHAHAAGAVAPPPSVDEAWAEVTAALHATAPTAADVAHRRQALSRHGTAEHVASLAKRRTPWGAVAFALVAGAAMFVVARQLGRTSTEVATERALASPEARILFASPGQRALVTLLDESKVTIGPDSRVIVPPGFGGKLRTVRLEGTASFDVARGLDEPFAVRAGNAIITALGTTFAVSAYAADDAVTVRVRQGRVKVESGDDSRTLAAGDAIAVARDGSMRVPSASATAETVGWTDGRLVVADRPLRTVLPLLRRWYGLDLKVKDPALLDRTLTMAPQLGVPRDAITALEASAKLKLVWQRDTMYLQAAPKAVKSAKRVRQR